MLTNVIEKCHQQNVLKQPETALVLICKYSK